MKKPKTSSSKSADSPVPYRIPDLIKLIDDRLGLLDNKSEKPMLKLLLDKISTITTDNRFKFMFDQAACGGDKIEEIISKIFRMPQNGLPICVLEMSGLPSEVVSSVASVLCRLAFDLAISSEGAIQTLVVCEEAHRYIPADIDAGFWPTRQAIGRIAKEGRKYGVYLGIITQRPSELDPTILSQCNTFFAMRLSNQKDQDIVAGAFNSSAQSTISFLPSIANRECIAFGEGLHSPMRMTFETVAAKDLPGASIRKNQEDTRAGKVVNLRSVISKMRKETNSLNLVGSSDDFDVSSSHNSSPSNIVAQRGDNSAQNRTGMPAAQATIAEIRANAASNASMTTPQTPVKPSIGLRKPISPMAARGSESMQKATTPNAGNSLIDSLRRK